MTTGPGFGTGVISAPAVPTFGCWLSDDSVFRSQKALLQFSLVMRMQWLCRRALLPGSAESVPARPVVV